MLRRLTTASVMLVGLTAAASADGYTTTRYAQSCCQYSWTGFYMGVNAGVLGDDTSHALIPGGLFLGPVYTPDNPQRTRTGDLDDTSLTGGVQAGYNYQMGMLVIGVEGDFNGAWSRPSDAVTVGLSAPLSGDLVHRVDAKLDWFGTLRGRLGITDARWMIYATGGWAFGRAMSSTSVQLSATGEVFSSSFTDTLSGWTAGGGFEYALRDNWTVKGEALWMDLGKVSYVSPERTVSPGFSYTTHLDLSEVVARIGVNYKFGARGPVPFK